MGHLRLGRLPKSRRWTQVVDLIEATADGGSAVSDAVARAADARLKALQSDPSVTYCFWLLTQLTRSARSAEFVTELDRLGLRIDASSSSLTFISQVSDLARANNSTNLESGAFAEIASLALRRALAETVGLHGRSLFGSTVDDLQHALRYYAGSDHFGQIAQRFFGHFLARSFRSFMERELWNHVGPSHGKQTISVGDTFLDAADLHAVESAGIVRQFAGDWFYRHNIAAPEGATIEEAGGFVAHAMQKLRSELKKEGR